MMHDPAVPLLLALAVVLGVARLMGWFAVRVGQPAVLGEIVGGILLGNLGLLGIHAVEPIAANPTLGVLAGLGVIVLLFEVGLESSVAQMLAVGAASLRVAVLGVVTPFALGWLVGAWLLPESSPYVHIFLGSVLTATSVGITARVLRDLNQGTSLEAKLILGAAVIDDVLGLIILAVVGGMIAAANAGGAANPLGTAGWITAKAVLFLAGAVGFGAWLAPRLLALASRVRVRGALLTSGLLVCFLLSYLSAQVGLAPIVGAFAAGLILEPAHFARFEESREHSLESLLLPISSFLVPIFFVVTGMHVDLASMADPRALGFAAVLTSAAIVGKQACSLGVWGVGVNRLAVGLGMIPRGEVGLIFANLGASLLIGGERIINPATYAAVVFMVAATTLITPPALQWGLRRRRGRPAS